MNGCRKVAAPIMLMVDVHVVFLSTVVVLLGYLSGTTEAGIYVVSYRIVALAFIPLEILNLRIDESYYWNIFRLVDLFMKQWKGVK